MGDAANLVVELLCEELPPKALKALGGYHAAGKLKTRESIVEGLANAPQGLVSLLRGGNFGKQLVKLA